MLGNYLTIAFRHLAKHKLLSGITLLCLVAGITFSLVMGVYILNQQQVNKDIRNVSSQFIVKSNWKVKEMGLDVTTLGPLPKAAKETYPSLVKNYYRFNPVTNVVSAGDKHFKENIAIGDTTLVSMYGFKLLHGNPQHAFANNGSAVVTASLAKKLFGTSQALDKTITLSNTTATRQDYIISGVLEDLPYNSVTNSIDPNGYSVYVPFEGNLFFGSQDYVNDWNNMYIVGAMELQPGVKASDLEKPFRELLTRHTTANIRDNLSVELAGVKDYYLQSNNGSVKKMLQTLGIIAGFILLMAVINFININIGTSSYRLKEIGLRKVFGSGKKQLVTRFIAESWILTFIAGIIAAGCYQLVLPLFNTVLNTSLTPVWQFSPAMVALLFLLITVVGFVAGIYPALVLSNKPILQAVKGKLSTAKGGMLFRKSLLVVQFSLAIIVFISAVIVSRQIAYVFRKDLGYNREKLLVLTAFPKQWDAEGVRKMETFRNGLKQLAAVKEATVSFEVPDRLPPNTRAILPAGSTNPPVLLAMISADENYARTFGLGVIEGNFFDNYRRGNANNEIVINEAASKALGFSSATGQVVTMAGDSTVYRIAGVIKDFNYSSLQQGIGPMAFLHTKDVNAYRYITLKLNATDPEKAIAAVKEKWTSLSPSAPFEYTFMDQRFENLYQSELQLQKAANIATILNLVIVFLGIFGVLSFTLARRIKEISLRKVLGANVRSILGLFIKDYAWLLLIANIIAWPVAYFITSKWLQQYAYRIQQELAPYAIVCGSVALLSFLLIIVQCFKTANSNPVKSLRTE